VKELLIRFAAWRARVGRRLNENPFWRDLTEFCRGVSLPLTGLAHGTLRVFPFLRKLEWLLEIEGLARRHPVVLVVTLAFVLFRGLMKTSLGHIATDKAIYPFIALVSGYNPFLGMLCGVSYGIGDLVQKFFLPDIYGARHWGDLNYWGAMVGYAVAYSSLMIMGLAPGMASRACRAVVGVAVRAYLRRRATAMADGGAPLPVSPAPLLEIAAGAVGAYAAGWTVMHEVAPVTERPAFYWRPQPDVSCHALEVNTHLRKPAPAVGGVAAAGAAIPVLAPPTMPAPAAPETQQYPDEIEWVAPDGKRHVLVRNAEGQYINILTGGVVDITRLDEWKETWSRNIAEQQEFSREQMEKLARRDTAFDREMDAWVAAQKEREKIWQNLTAMERNIWFGQGPESHLWKAPGEPGNILDHIARLKEQLSRREPFDLDKYQQVVRVYQGIKKGDILTEAQLPTSGELTREIISNGLKETAREFITGQRSDGSISWLGLTGRLLTAGVTGGASELVLTPTEALIQMKDYVDRGGNSIIGGFARTGGSIVAGEIFSTVGQVLHAGIKRVGPAVDRLAGEALERLAQKGGSAARQVLNAFGSARNGLSNVANSIKGVLSGKKPSVSTAVRPKPPGSVGGAFTRIPAGPAPGRSVNIVRADVPVERYLKAYPPKAVSHARVVADKYGVTLDLRPANPESRVLLETRQAVPKPSFVKNKSLTREDLLLGAKGQPGQVGHYLPKLPPKGNMTDAQYQRLKELYKLREREYFNESIHIHKLKTQGRIEVRDGVIYDKTTGKPMASDIDIFDIRDARTGKPLPRYAVDKDGNLIIDPVTGQPKLHPVREQIIKELQNGPFQAQHGAHMDWKYDHLPSKSHDAMIDRGVLEKHQARIPIKDAEGNVIGYREGEPLVAIGPGDQVETVFIEGGV